MPQIQLPLLPRERGVELNKVDDADRPAHWWYRFVLSFPPHLVRDYVQRFGLQTGQCVLDPFCGTGTTIVECKKLGIHGIGIEAHPRDLVRVLPEASIDAVITSPPYPNENDYTRTTRLESVLLGFVSSKDQLRALKRTMVRSNTRGVYKGDDDDRWIAGHEEIERIAGAIEARRIELNKTSGFLAPPKTSNRYALLIETIFHSSYRAGALEVDFERSEIESTARRLKIILPKNLGDLIYSFRFRAPLPDSIRSLAPAGKEWILVPPEELSSEDLETYRKKRGESP